MWGNEQSAGNAAIASMPSGNGNANCFWEDPSVSKAVASSKGQAHIQQNGTGKLLSKSQTVSSMQSVANSPKTNTSAAKSSATISKTSSSGNVTAIVNSTSNNNNKKSKMGNSNVKKGKIGNWKFVAIDRNDGIIEYTSDADDEFGVWCAKALASHNDIIDGEFEHSSTFFGIFATNDS